MIEVHCYLVENPTIWGIRMPGIFWACKELGPSPGFPKVYWVEMKGTVGVNDET